MQKEHKDKMAASMATAESIAALHSECDWLVANFGTRKEARANELENLASAKAVLSGADYSFLQTATATLHHQ